MTTCRARARLAAVGLVASLVVTLGCSAAALRTQVAPPWPSHSYRSVVISAPSTWHIYRNAACTPNEHPGALALGVANGPGTCVDQGGPPGAVVQVSSLDPGVLHTLPPPLGSTVLHVNGLTVLSSTYTSGLTFWQVPSEGIEVTGRGPNALIVMATLRRS
jgi:hypothetical protein